MDNLIQTVEAIIFSAGTEIKKKDILDKLPLSVTKKELNDAVKALSQKYNGDCGIVLLEFNDKVQFSSNPMYGDIVAEVLRPIKEKELSNVLLEVLAMIAYKQPITRGEIEEVRGASADYAITMLTRANLIKVNGHKNTPGRPWLYITTDEFLKKFCLHSLDELPDYKEVMRRLVEFGNFNRQSEGLYKEVNLADGFDGEVFESNYDVNDVSAVKKELDALLNTDELPDFLSEEDVMVFEGDGNNEDIARSEAAADIAGDYDEE